MTASNLAICVAPNIFATIPNQDAISALYTNDCQTKVVTYMIQYYTYIFDGLYIEPDEFMKDTDVDIITRSTRADVQIDQIRRRWAYRSDSVIPYVPTHLFNDPSFKRPTEPYHP